MENIESPFIV